MTAQNLSVCPCFVQLGEFRARAENMYLLEFDYDSYADVTCSTYGVEIPTRHLHTGRNNMIMIISHVSPEVYLCGTIDFSSNGIHRQLVFLGKAYDNIPAVTRRMRFTGSQWEYTRIVQNGERVNLYDFGKTRKDFLIEFFSGESNSCSKKINPFVLLLNENNQARSQNDIFSSGNTGKNGSSIYIYNGEVHINPYKMDSEIHKAELYYSLSEESLRKFHILVSSYDGQKKTEHCYLPVEIPEDTNNSNSIFVLEFYRKDNTWKIHFGGTLRRRKCN